MAVPASAVSMSPLDSEVLRGYVAGVDGARDLSLTAVWLPLDSSDAEGTTVVATCYPLLCRENGFMLLVPKTEEVTAALQGVASLCSAEPATWEGEVDLITVRGRLLGKQECQLVDLTWDYVPHLCKALVLRGAAKQSTQVVHFQLGGASGRPVAQSALSLADQWITAGLGLDPESAQEYLTGEELVRDDDPDLASPSAPGSQAGGDGHLQARIKVLEEQLAGLHQAVSTQPRAQARLPLGGLQASHAKHGQEQQLFSAQGSALRPEELARLQQLAGAPPGRLQTAVAKQPPAAERQVAVLDGLQAEAEKEVLADPDAHLLDLGLDPMQVTDPVQRLLLLQMQQNTVLMRRFAQPRDPMSSLLGGGGSESGSSSGGARGCLARDMYLKTIQDLPRVAEVARQNALQEPGISRDKEDKDLMHLYVERRIPLAENKLLAHFAVLAAEGWSIAQSSNNHEMQGFLARMLFFVEQSALDGKVDLGWLMAGFPEPNTHLHFSTKRVPGLKPFTRLASPLWVSANLAFLRDLDYLEGRIQTIGKPKGKSQSHTTDPDEVPKPKGKPKPKKGKKGSGKEGEAEPSAP